MEFVLRGDSSIQHSIWLKNFLNYGKRIKRKQMIFVTNFSFYIIYIERKKHDKMLEPHSCDVPIFFHGLNIYSVKKLGHYG